MAVTGALISRYGVNVPYQDQFDLVPLFQRQKTGALSLHDFWVQGNEHRMVFPRIIMLGLANLTRWNIRAELLVNFVLASAMFVLLVFLVRKTLQPSLKGLVGVIAIPLSIFLFSPVQWDNWLLGFQISWFLALLMALIAAVALAVWPADQPAWQPVTIAAAAAVVSQYSLASGVLVWIVCLPTFIARAHLRRLVLPWVLAGSASTALFFWHWQAQGGHSFVANLLDHPKNVALFVLYYLGRPVLYAHVTTGPPSYFAGTAFLVVFIASVGYLLLFRRDRIEPALGWLSIGGFGLMSAVITAVGRSARGPQAAEPSRYTTVSILFVVATLALATLALAPQEPLEKGVSWRLGLALGGWLLVAGAFLFHFNAELGLMKAASAGRTRELACLRRTKDPSDPCLFLAYPNTQVAFERAQTLKKLGWGGL